MHKEYSIQISSGHISTSYNELSKCIINGFSDKINGSLKISRADIKLCEFLHKVKMATLCQINKYFEIIGSNKNWINRLEKLNKSYNLINEVTLLEKGKESVVFYTLDIGGMYLLSNFSNEDVNPRIDDLTSQKKTYESMFKIHPHSAIKSLLCTQIYIIELEQSKILNVENRFRIRECLNLREDEIKSGKSSFLNLKIDLMLALENVNLTGYFVKIIVYDEIDKICTYIEKFHEFSQKREFIDKYCSLNVEEVKLCLVVSDDEYYEFVKLELENKDIKMENILIRNKELTIVEGIYLEEYIAI